MKTGKDKWKCPFCHTGELFIFSVDTDGCNSYSVIDCSMCDNFEGKQGEVFLETLLNLYRKTIEAEKVDDG